MALLSSAMVLLATGIGFWVAATDPTVTWFGSVNAHGSRRHNTVALTFDDGPNDTATTAIARILGQHHVHATFFATGTALEQRPEIGRKLVTEGHLLASHSMHHDSWRWLDPRYPDLDVAQRAFKRHVGRCPALFRPPHGRRTPFMTRMLSKRNMTMVLWDTSAADWETRDAALVARRVLTRVRPGSIILLHDGLDGDVHADRRVIVRALPLILAGLESRGLKVVRLDTLLGVHPYLRDC